MFSYEYGIDYEFYPQSRSVMNSFQGAGKVLIWLAAGGIYVNEREYPFYSDIIATQYLEEIKAWDGESPVKIP